LIRDNELASLLSLYHLLQPVHPEAKFLTVSLRPAFEGGRKSLRIVDPDSPKWVTGTIVFQRANR
jgi:hypothetical protein